MEALTDCHRAARQVRQPVLPLCGFSPTYLWVDRLFVGCFVGELFFIISVGKFCWYSEYLWVIMWANVKYWIIYLFLPISANLLQKITSNILNLAYWTWLSVSRLDHVSFLWILWSHPLWWLRSSHPLMSPGGLESHSVTSLSWIRSMLSQIIRHNLTHVHSVTAILLGLFMFLRSKLGN